MVSSESLFSAPTHNAVLTAGYASRSTALPSTWNSPVNVCPFPVMETYLPSTQMRVRVISFWVRVPVLSEQITVVEPSVSTDDKPADERMPLDHLAHPQRQADRHHGRQALGHGSNRQVPPPA